MRTFHAGVSPPELEGATAADIRPAVRCLLADRRSPEAAAVVGIVMRYTHRRVIAVSRACGAALSDSEQEELVGEVVVALLQGALAGFRGTSLAELLGFVRTIADRTTWRTIRVRERERRTAMSASREAPERYSSTIPRPDQHFEFVPDSPLPEADQAYLKALLEAGSKADLARRHGVSRAAVTQRVQRIVARVAALAPGERMAHEVWMEQQARKAIDEDPSLILRAE